MSKEKYCIRDNWLIDPSGAPSVAVGGAAWFDWLAAPTHHHFRYEGPAGSFYAQRELRRDMAYWYAYRRRGGRLFKTYLGHSADLSQERLEQAGLYLSGESLPTATPLPAHAEPGEALAVPFLPPPSPPLLAEPSFSILPLTKIRPPYLPEKLVARPRLTQLIRLPVTVIYAPSGFGKSTLLNEWRLSCGFPVAWVSLDETDDQPQRFWNTVGLALEALSPEFNQVFTAHLRAQAGADLRRVVVAFTNEIMRITEGSGTIRPLALVLDDFHHIQHAEIHESLQTFLEYLPPNLRLVISSHTRPPLALGHLRAMSMVTELTVDDLRFTIEEGMRFLNQSPHTARLSYQELHSLVRHSEGWIAGLNLATLALAQPGNQGQILAGFTGAHAYLREYFAESVFQQQEPQVQAFLLKTSILKQLSGPLCDAVTGQSNGAQLLERFFSENLFIERLEEKGWFRYHDLFAEMLFSLLQSQWPDQIADLHRRASEWFLAQNAPADAIYHLLAIQAWDEAAALIEHMALQELEQFGEDSRLLRWLQQLPENIVQRHRTLLSVYIRLAGVAQPTRDVLNFLGRLENNISHQSAARLTADEQDVLSETQRFRDLIVAGQLVSASPAASEGHEAIWQLLSGVMAYQRNHCTDVDQGVSLARQVYDAARARRNLFVICIAGGGYANLSLLQGNLRRSERIARQVLQQAIGLRGSLPETTSFALSVLGQLCYERDELAQAHQFLSRALEVDPNPTSTNSSITTAILRAKIQARQGNVSAALLTLQAARDLQNRRPAGVWYDQDLLAYQVLYRLRIAQITEDELNLSELDRNQPHPLTMYVLAELYYQQGRSAEAEALLVRLLTDYPHGFYNEPVMSCRVLLALALFDLKRYNQARQTIGEAIRSAAQETFLRPFVEHAADLAPLLGLLQRSENLTPEAQAFIKDVLRTSESTGRNRLSVPEENLAALTTAASITLREQEVLARLGVGLSNRAIATSLSISESTVKTHLGNIYFKLKVNNRIQAITRAHELDLI